MGGRKVTVAGDGAERIGGPAGAYLSIEWFRRGRGPFGLDRRADRGAGATHARVTEYDGRGTAVHQWIEPAAAADAVIAAVRDRWAGAGGPAEGATTPVEGAASPVRAVAPRCGYCGIARVSRGRQAFVQRVRVAPNLSLDDQKLWLEVFACPRCGSVEFFEAPA